MDMVMRIKNKLGSENPDNVFLWLDFFALNLHQKDRTAFNRVKVSLQHPPWVHSAAARKPVPGCWAQSTMVCKERLHPLHRHGSDSVMVATQDALMISKRGTLAIMEPGALIASCCLYELWLTVNKRGLRFLHMVEGNSASPDDWDDAVLELDIFACKSSKQRDRGIIFKAVSARGMPNPALLRSPSSECHAVRCDRDLSNECLVCTVGMTGERWPRGRNAE